MTSERDLAEAQVLRRRRLVLAFRRGSDRPSLLDEPRRSRALFAGVGVAVLCALGSGITGLIKNEPPDGWDDDGSVVLAKETGTRFLVVDGVLRPVVNDTALRLATGAGRRPVQIEEKLLDAMPKGLPLGDAATPSAPPSLAAERTWIACVQGGDSAVVIDGELPKAPEVPVSVLASFNGTPWLITGGKRYALAPGIQSALGYEDVPALAVPEGWLVTIPAGPTLERIDVPPAPRLLTDTDTDEVYIETADVLRPVLSRTTLQLVYGQDVPSPEPVSGAFVKTRQTGPPLGEPGWPASPPSVATPGGKTWMCVRGSDAALVPLDSLPTEGKLKAEGTKRTAVVWQRPDVGLLVAKEEYPPDERPTFLVAGGRTYLIESPDVITALGYDESQIQLVPKRWVHLLPTGPALKRIET